MSSTAFVGGLEAAYQAMFAINTAYAAAGSSRSIVGVATFSDGLDDSEVESITLDDTGGKWVGAPTGGTPDSTNCVFWCTTSEGNNAYKNAADGLAAYRVGLASVGGDGIAAFQEYVDAA